MKINAKVPVEYILKAFYNLCNMYTEWYYWKYLSDNRDSCYDEL